MSRNPTLDEIRKSSPTTAKLIEEELRRQDARKDARHGFPTVESENGGPGMMPNLRCILVPGGQPIPAIGAPRRKYNAIPTVCSAGHRHPSKVEARVCAVVRAELDPMDERLLRQVRLGLPALAGDDDDRALYFTVDFAIVRGGRWFRFIDAKSGRRRSPEWLRGKKAAEASYGLKVEEIQA